MINLLLRVEGLTRQFEGIVAVNNVSFDIKKDEILAVIGPNGAGKSTVFNLISGILRPTSGKIYLKGDSITGLKPYIISKKGVSRTFQTTSLFDRLRVVDNLAVGCRQHLSSGFWGTVFYSGRRRAELTAKIMETAYFIGLSDKAFEMVSTLTREEQKRLAIGVALMGRPKIVLLDEPTGGLMQDETRRITSLIEKIRASGIAICLIEHKMSMVMSLADRIVFLKHGVKLAEGTPAEIASNPDVIGACLGKEYIA
ncbi:MAG: ABC transporter ATP-binding protein [Bacillota bacterium]